MKHGSFQKPWSVFSHVFIDVKLCVIDLIHSRGIVLYAGMSKVKFWLEEMEETSVDFNLKSWCHNFNDFPNKLNSLAGAFR